MPRKVYSFESGGALNAGSGARITQSTKEDYIKTGLGGFVEGLDKLKGANASEEEMFNYVKANVENLLDTDYDRAEGNSTLSKHLTEANSRNKRTIRNAVFVGIAALVIGAVGAGYFGHGAGYNNGVTQSRKRAEEWVDYSKGLQGQVKDKDNIISEYEKLFEGVFGKPPAKAQETPSTKAQ